MDIRFCDQCDASIPEIDVDRGVACRLEGRLLCSLCLPRAKRQRVLALLLQPLALLAAAVLGAGAAVWFITPQIEALRTEIAGLKAADADRPLVDPAVVATLERLSSLSGTLVEARKSLETEVARRDAEMNAAIADGQSKLTRLAADVREIREFLAAAAEQPTIPAHPEPGQSPGAAPEEAPPAAEPTIDLSTWLPLAADPDSGVRLSALVALEPSRDPRVLDAARAALSDGDAVVRAQGVKMVEDRDDQESVSDLIDLLEDRNARVRVVAHRALEALTGLELRFDSADSDDTRAGAVQAIRILLGR